MPDAQTPHALRARPALWTVLLLALTFTACQNEQDNAPGTLDATNGTTSVLYRWVELGPQGVALARAVVDASGAACPSIVVDGDSLSMSPRTLQGQPPPGFEAVQVCEYTLPSGASSASIDGQALALPSADPQQIVVVGDTGCRIKGNDVQDCDDPAAWTFARVADAIVAADPDLIVHVGDYHYREGDGSQQLDTCDSTRIGYCWASWEADFFAPAATLLPAAPWIFIRGNHEDCGTGGLSSDPPRAWRGWFYLLDPRPLDTLFPGGVWNQDACPAYTNPYLVAAGNQNILVMDTSEIPDDYGARPESTTVARYAHEFTLMDSLAAGQTDTWLATHRPFWAVASWGTSSIGPTDATLQAALQASIDQKLPDAIDLLLAGHIHLFESLTFGDGRPPQFVFGNGGTLRDPAIPPNHQGVLDALGATGFAFSHRFDYGVIAPTQDGWSVAVKDTLGADLETFIVKKN